jgi:MFS superfamily sulfate permease-like transporter
MERTFGISYPTVKSRQSRIANQLQFVEKSALPKKEEILAKSKRRGLDEREQMIEDDSYSYGLIAVLALVLIFGIDTKTVKDIASVSGGFPPFHIPNIPISWETLKLIFPYALIMASVGLTEGLLTLNL